MIMKKSLLFACGLAAMVIAMPVQATTPVSGVASADGFVYSDYANGTLFAQSHDDNQPNTASIALQPSTSSFSSDIFATANTSGSIQSGANISAHADMLTRVQADSGGDINYSFFNDTGNAVHGYLDFSVSGIRMFAGSTAGTHGDYGSQIFVYGHQYVDNVVVPTAGELFDASFINGAFSQSFDSAALMNTATTLSCVGLGCTGDIGGILDLGVIDVGKTLSLDYVVNSRAYGSLSTFAQTSNETSTASFRFNPISSSVPEPATWACMIAGFSLLGAGLRRRDGQGKGRHFLNT